MYNTFSFKNKQLAERLSKKIDPNFSDLGIKEQLPIQQKGLDEKYKETLEKLRNFKTKNQRYLLQINHDKEKIEDVIFGLEKSKNKYNDSQSQIYESFQRLVQTQQGENSQKMNTVRKGMIEDIQKKKKAMKSDAIQVIQSQFQQLCKSNLGDIQKNMNVVLSALQQQRINKQQSASFLAQSIGEQILKMEQLIAEEKQERAKQNQSIFELISQIEKKVYEDLQQQAKLRQKAEQQIQCRLQSICYKIEAKILGNF